MKSGVLRSVGHNLADSLASGICLLIGYREVSVFADAMRSPQKYVEVDFLNGIVTEGKASDSLTKAVYEYSKSLDKFCKKSGARAENFAALAARFHYGATERIVEVLVADTRGIFSIDTYVGVPLRRRRTQDKLGRIRRSPGRVWHIELPDFSSTPRRR